MAQDTPARKRIAFLIILIALISVTSTATVSAATKKTSTKSTTTQKKATTTAASKKKTVVSSTKKTTSTAKKVKGEKITANKVSVVGDNTISTYTVKKGDTISGIAKKFDISVNTIRWSNNINSKGTIHVGESLTILPTTGVIYTVKTGDTLSGIAVKFSADQNDILNANDLESADSLKVGMKLSIPNVEPLDTASTNDSVPDTTTPPTNISPLPISPDDTVPASQTPLVTTPVVTSPTTGETIPTPGTTMMVTNPVTSNTYSIVVTQPVNPTGYPIPVNDIRGYYAQPVSGRLSQGIHDVNAVDIATPVGTTVHAAAAGTVIVANDSGYNGGYGKYMVVSHPNGTQTLYAHLSRITVSLGEVVAQGEPIALSGNTGKTTGAHLHFEVRGGINPWGADAKGTTYEI